VDAVAGQLADTVVKSRTAGRLTDWSTVIDSLVSAIASLALLRRSRWLFSPTVSIPTMCGRVGCGLGWYGWAMGKISRVK